MGRILTVLKDHVAALIKKKSSTLNSVQIVFEHSVCFCDFYTFQHGETKD